MAIPVLNKAGASSYIFNNNSIEPLNSLAVRNTSANAYIPAKALFISALQFNSNQILSFLNKLYDKKNYYVRNTVAYTIDENRKTIIVSCTLQNQEGRYIQYTERSSSSGVTGCPVSLHKKTTVLLKANIKIENSRFVEVNIINI